MRASAGLCSFLTASHDAVLADMRAVQGVAASHKAVSAASHLPKGQLAGLVAGDERVDGAGCERAHAVAVAVQRVCGRGVQAAQAPPPYHLRQGSSMHTAQQRTL